MSNEKHTPGPWVPYFWSHLTKFHGLPSSIGAETDEGEFDIVQFGSDHRDCPVEEQHANARLIAAAPDLLAALEIVASECNGNQLNYAETRQVARDAIAKAKVGQDIEREISAQQREAERAKPNGVKS